MNKPTRLDEMNARLNPIGFHVDDYSPGDGKTRYKFMIHEPGTDPPAYFATDGVKRVIGWKNAELYVDGLLHGAARAKEMH